MITCDKDSDVLYINIKPGVPAENTIEIAPGILIRYSKKEDRSSATFNDIIGITIIDFEKRMEDK